MPKGLNSKLFASDHDGGRSVQMAVVKKAMGSKDNGSHSDRVSMSQMVGDKKSFQRVDDVSPGGGAARKSGKGGAKAGGTKHC